jgi:hypothetical protein
LAGAATPRHATPHRRAARRGCVEYLPQRPPPRFSAWLRCRQERLDPSPLSIGQIDCATQWSRLCRRHVARIQIKVPSRIRHPLGITLPPATQPIPGS